jgi:hypothetical protein
MGALPDLELLKIRRYCEEKTPQRVAGFGRAVACHIYSIYVLYWLIW